MGPITFVLFGLKEPYIGRIYTTKQMQMVRACGSVWTKSTCPITGQLFAALTAYEFSTEDESSDDETTIAQASTQPPVQAHPGNLPTQTADFDEAHITVAKLCGKDDDRAIANRKTLRTRAANDAIVAQHFGSGSRHW